MLFPDIDITALWLDDVTDGHHSSTAVPYVLCSILHVYFLSETVLHNGEASQTPAETRSEISGHERHNGGTLSVQVILKIRMLTLVT